MVGAVGMTLQGHRKLGPALRFSQLCYTLESNYCALSMVCSV
jgi:hypothetical protein